jgi:hypothetical protein
VAGREKTALPVSLQLPQTRAKTNAQINLDLFGLDWSFKQAGWFCEGVKGFGR